MAKKVKFHTTRAELELAQPWPASKLMPGWYRKLKGVNDGRPTIKKCIPVLDAMTSGYIIPLPVDVHWSDSSKKFTSPSAFPLVDGHPFVQIEGVDLPVGFEPEAHKWINSWHMKTPKGYSTLFIHPLNREDLPFHSLSGVVDTDKHPVPVNFPFLLREGFEGTIPAGTPMIQAIPFKRDDWEAVIVNNTSHTYDKQYEIGKPPFNWYKRKWWSRKRYS